jgi:hypothetical protein
MKTLNIRFSIPSDLSGLELPLIHAKNLLNGFMAYVRSGIPPFGAFFGVPSPKAFS